MRANRSAHRRWLRVSALVSALALLAPGIAHGQTASLLGGFSFSANSGLPGSDTGPGDVAFRAGTTCVDRGGPIDFFNPGRLVFVATGPVAEPGTGTFTAEVDTTWPPSVVSTAGMGTLSEKFSVDSPLGTATGVASAVRVSGICKAGGGFFDIRGVATWLGLVRTPEGTFLEHGPSSFFLNTVLFAPVGSITSFSQGLDIEGAPVPFRKQDCDRGTEVVVAIFGGSKKACMDFVKGGK
jgi:hypothetical protein